MPQSFLSSEEYDDHAHELYNRGEYDEALEVLREGIQLYPHAPELHVGMGYARLAREEYAWARRSFEEALTFDGEHEEALAGYGETLLKFGAHERAISCFDRVLSLGFQDDHDLLLQIGRALFREGRFEDARRYFGLAATVHSDSPEAAACVGYAAHRLHDEDGAFTWLRRAVDLDGSHSEARIYLGNLHYDRGEFEAALYNFERAHVEEYGDELSLWRTVELKKTIYRLAEDGPELRPLFERLSELTIATDLTQQLLHELETRGPGGEPRDPTQLELFGALLTQLQGMQQRPLGGEAHRVTLPGGASYAGTFEQIVLSMKEDDVELSSTTVDVFMSELARRCELLTGVAVPATDPESFIRASARAGVLRLLH
jgi:tetratricopeptide (TPR) repeat protein